MHREAPGVAPGASCCQRPAAPPVMARACNARCDTDSTNLYPRHHRRSERHARGVALNVSPWPLAMLRPLRGVRPLMTWTKTSSPRLPPKRGPSGAGPAAAVDELVRGLLGQLADWQQSIGELGRALTTAAEADRYPAGPPPPAAPPRTSGGARPAPRCSRPSHATTSSPARCHRRAGR